MNIQKMNASLDGLLLFYKGIIVYTKAIQQFKKIALQKAVLF